MIFKRASVNLLMIQITIFATSLIVALQMPPDITLGKALPFIWIAFAGITLIPSILVSTVFAYVQERRDGKV